MGCLIIIRGNSGSGKTTIARELQNRFGSNTMLISQDIIRRYMLKVKDNENTPALPLIKELLAYGNKNNDIVILEGILYSDWYKSLFDFGIKLYGAKVYAYYFDLPFQETLRRHRTKASSDDYGLNELRRWWKEKDYYEPLHEICITRERDIESIVNQIYETVING